MVTRRTHILPQGYLKHFTTTGKKNGKIFCYDLQKEEFISKEGVTTKGLGRKPYIYTLLGETSATHDNWIEDQFALIETEVLDGQNQLIGLINEGYNAGKIQWEVINENRVPNLIQLLFIKTIGERFISSKDIIQVMQNNFNEACENALRDNPFSEDDMKKAISEASKDFNPLNEAKKIFSSIRIPQARRSSFINSIKNKNHHFFVIENDEEEFALSDFPIYLHPTNNNIASFVDSNNTILTITLSKKIVLQIGKEADSKRDITILKTNQVDIGKIKEINQMVIANACRFIGSTSEIQSAKILSFKKNNPFPPNSFSNVEWLISKYKANRKPPLDKSS